ncbi:MAG: diaminopimelate decarboxylase [Anaerolineaceae bacterium]|nr:diaminopimelate decarboxylase [Anaerolineaceae bacterium]
MDYFEYRGGELFAENVPVAEIAAKVGTPLYIYSRRTLQEHYERMARAFREVDPLICYSVKSNPNLGVLKVLAALGAGFDIVSGGELYRVVKAGGDSGKCFYAGVGKTSEEIRFALERGIYMFNVESEAEFENIDRIAAEMGKCPKCALRINPDIDPATHKHTATGKKESKFGVDLARGEKFFATYGQAAAARLVGIHLHIGSPIATAEPYVEAIAKALKLIERLRKKGAPIEVLNIGGGFAAWYESGQSIMIDDYAEAIVPLVKDQGLQIVMEPGRSISANAGILVGAVQYLKNGGDRKFVIVNTGMHHLIRPPLYGGWHFVWPVAPGEEMTPPDRSREVPLEGLGKCDVVGPICESGDFLATDRMLPPVERGDLLAVFGAGAYAMSMASNYNSQVRPVEVLVDHDRFEVVRRRETYEDLIRGEG